MLCCELRGRLGFDSVRFWAVRERCRGGFALGGGGGAVARPSVGARCQRVWVRSLLGGGVGVLGAGEGPRVSGLGVRGSIRVARVGWWGCGRNWSRNGCFEARFCNWSRNACFEARFCAPVVFVGRNMPGSPGFLGPEKRPTATSRRGLINFQSAAQGSTLEIY